MKPSDFRNATWETIQEQIEGQRHAVYAAWQQYGPGTTRAVAAAAQIDLLTFRPRSTELFQLGLLRLVETKHDGHLHEGRYAAVPIEDARAAHESALARQPEQFLMKMSAPVPQPSLARQTTAGCPQGEALPRQICSAASAAGCNRQS